MHRVLFTIAFAASKIFLLDMWNKVQRFIRSIWQRLPVGSKITVARAIQPKFTVSATGILVNEKNEVLILEHILRPGSGWGLPGGFVKRAEQLEDALRREMMEEIGVELADVQTYCARTNRTHVEIFFVAKPIGEPHVKSREIIGLKWCKVEELPSDMSRTQTLLIREVLQRKVDKNGSQGLKS